MKTNNSEKLQVYFSAILEDAKGKEFKIVCAGKKGLYLKCKIKDGKSEYEEFSSYENMIQFIEDFKKGLVQPTFH